LLPIRVLKNIHGESPKFKRSVFSIKTILMSAQALRAGGESVLRTWQMARCQQTITSVVSSFSQQGTASKPSDAPVEREVSEASGFPTGGPEFRAYSGPKPVPAAQRENWRITRSAAKSLNGARSAD
jgi:hypothetical protein